MIIHSLIFNIMNEINTIAMVPITHNNALISVNGFYNSKTHSCLRFSLLDNWIIFFLELRSIYKYHICACHHHLLHCLYVDRPFDGQDGFQTVNIGTTVNFDGDRHGDGTCKQTFRMIWFGL